MAPSMKRPAKKRTLAGEEEVRWDKDILHMYVCMYILIWYDANTCKYMRIHANTTYVYLKLLVVLLHSMHTSLPPSLQGARAATNGITNLAHTHTISLLSVLYQDHSQWQIHPWMVKRSNRWGERFCMNHNPLSMETTCPLFMLLTADSCCWKDGDQLCQATRDQGCILCFQVQDWNVEVWSADLSET